jgi:putative endonuclease
VREPLDREAAARRGALGESIAARFLELQGCTVLQRNARHAGVELDLVARQGTCLLLVEVKLRASPLVPAPASLAPRQEQRLLRGARTLLARHAWATELRLDVIAIDVRAASLRLEHLRGVLPRWRRRSD